MLFKLESLGIYDNDVSDFDREQIITFKDDIGLVEGKYRVKLPWHPC